MNRIHLLALVAACALHAAPPLEFVGVLTTGGEPLLRIVDRSTDRSRWLRVGAAFRGFTLVAYAAPSETATLVRGTEQIHLTLPRSVISSDHSLPAEIISAIRTNLQVLATAAQLRFMEGTSHYVTLDDLVGPGKAIRQVVPLAGEDYRRLSFMKGEIDGLSVTTASGETITVHDAGDWLRR